MTTKKIVIYAVLAVSATVLWCWTHSERAQIKRVFASIEKIITKERGESVIEGAGKTQSITKYFGDKCEVVALGYGIDVICSRDDISGGVLAMRTNAARIGVRFEDLKISVDGNVAYVEGGIDFSGTDTAWHAQTPRYEKFFANLEKVNGQWLIKRIKQL